MSYYGYITRIKNLRKHPNADRLMLGECFGNTVCVDLSYEPDELGVYFPVDGQVSADFGTNNNLLRQKDENGNNVGGYMDPDKRNIKAIKLRGEKSDGLFLHLKCLAYTGVDLNTLEEGMRFTTINGQEVCQKYFPRRNRAHYNGPKPKKINKALTAPLFREHIDTEQLVYNLDAFKPGDELEVTLKAHGSSQRTAYLPVLKGYKRSFIDLLLGRPGKPIYDWGYVTGTRRTICNSDYTGGFYGNDTFRKGPAEFFKDKLWKGETVYYEVVGFIDNGTPIMPKVSNKGVNDKDFIKQYGKETVFSYGCEPDGWTRGEPGPGFRKPRNDFYVYRMTMTNEDGDVVEYTPDFMRFRCEQMGAKCVPLMCKAYIFNDRIEICDATNGEVSEDFDSETYGEGVKKLTELYYDGADPIGKTHIREGVVVRIVNRPTFTAYKNKNFYFKVVEGIAKDVAETPDIEEAQEEDNNNEE